jgi:hypothetical protein
MVRRKPAGQQGIVSHGEVRAASISGFTSSAEPQTRIFWVYQIVRAMGCAASTGTMMLPAGRRRLLVRRPRSRWRPARPSEDGGFEDVVEFGSRRASWRSRSAIWLSLSDLLRVFSVLSVAFGQRKVKTLDCTLQPLCFVVVPRALGPRHKSHRYADRINL